MRFRGSGPKFALISMDALLGAEFEALSKSAAKLLLYLHGICYGGPTEIRPYDVSQFDLSEILRCSAKTVSRSVAELEKGNFLAVVREYDGFQQRKINVYTLTGNSLPYHRENATSLSSNKTRMSSNRRTHPGDKVVPYTNVLTEALTTDDLTLKNSEMSDKELDLYNQLIEHLIEEYGYQDISIWLKSSALKMDGNTTTIHCMTAEHCGWVVENFLPGITSSLSALGLSEPVEITAPGLLPPDGPSPN